LEDKTSLLLYSIDFYFKSDDTVEALNQWIPSTTTTNLDLFLSKLKNENEYSPFGEQILTYEFKGEKSTSYLIHRVNQNFCDDKKFVEWYSRLETFLVFYIDAASRIDKDDPNWIIYLLYQQYQNDNGQICYAPIGFITVYLYYAYPDKKRPRIRLENFFFYSFI
jgi:histone acetyltransferase 1